MNILVAEKLSVTGLNYLEDAGYTVDVRMGMTPEELVATIPGYAALIVRSATKVTREVIEAGSSLKIIGRAGVGVDNVDIEAATEHGIIVCNAPMANTVSAAEHTIAMMLAIARHIPQADASMKDHKWERSQFMGSELIDKTLAIFGLGRVGGLVAERAAAFGMRLIGHDPFCSPERAAHLGVTLYDDVMELLPQADFITLHLPATRDTIGMFGPEQYAVMKDGVYLINCASGPIFNVESMADFIAAGKIAGAAIDAWEDEPCIDSPLHEFDNVVLTPHLNASTREAQDRAGTQIAEYVSLGLEGRMVPSALNVALVPAEVMEAVNPYVAACQMAGEVIAQIAREGVSTLDLNVCGPLAAYDVNVLGTAVLRSIFAESSADPVNFVNADYIAQQRGVTVNVRQDPESLDYANVVHIRAKAGDQNIEISVTTSGANAVPRIVSILGYDLDLVPGQNIMILMYADKPGKLGLIGTITGKHNINISSMELGNNGNEGGMALILMNIDQPVPKDVQDEIAQAVGLEQGWYLTL